MFDGGEKTFQTYLTYLKNSYNTIFKKHRYTCYYLFWLFTVILITIFANTSLLKDKYNYICQTALLLFFIIFCTPLYKFLSKLSDVLFHRQHIHKFLALAGFSAIYLFVSYFIFAEYCYSGVSFSKEKIIVYKLLFNIKIDSLQLSKIVLFYIDLAAILILGIFPAFITVRLKLTNKYDPAPYFKRLIPLMKTIFEEKINLILIGAVVNIVMVFFLSKLILSGDSIKFTNYNELQLLRWTFVLITTWLSSFSAWMSPFLMGLTIHLETTISHTYNRKLRHIIDAWENHIIVIGHGDLGKMAVKEIRQIALIKNRFTYILIPNIKLDFIQIRTDLAVVDKDEKLFDFVHSPMPDMKTGIARVFNEKEQAYSPAVIGDINLPSTIEQVNLLKASLVINIPKDEDSTFSVLNFKSNATKDEDSTFSVLNFKSNATNKEKIPNFVLSFYRTSDKSYFITRGLNVGEYFLYPIQVSGTTIGDTLYSFYRKDSLPCENQGNNSICSEKLLIIGSGKQLFFIVESFWIKIKEHFNSNIETVEKYFENSVRLLTNSSYIENHSIGDKWQIPVPRAVRLRGHSNYLEIQLEKGSPTNLIDLQKTIQERGPGKTGQRHKW